MSAVCSKVVALQYYVHFSSSNYACVLPTARDYAYIVHVSEVLVNVHVLCLFVCLLCP